MARCGAELGLRSSREGHENLPPSRGIENKAKEPNSNKEALPEDSDLLHELLIEEATGGAGGGAGVGANGAFSGLGVLPPPDSPLRKPSSNCSRLLARLPACSLKSMVKSRLAFSNLLTNCILATELSKTAFGSVATEKLACGSFVVADLEIGVDIGSDPGSEKADRSNTGAELDPTTGSERIGVGIARLGTSSSEVVAHLP